MTDLTHLAHALTVRALSRSEPAYAHAGAALAVLRGDVYTGCYPDHPAAGHAQTIYDEIMAVGMADMPPSTDLVAILLETLAQRLDGLSWAAAWQSIGIKPSRGRDLLTRSAQALDWPIWYTLREAALRDTPPPS